MTDKSTRGGPNVGLLLVIPAVAMAARAAMRHHQMLWAEGGEAEPAIPHRRHGPRGRHAFGAGAARGDLRLPPRIEAVLAQWHTRAHAAGTPHEDELRA